ncbi:MAG TPA: AmmeMemoRadiSam system radical SAM enzyme [Bacteroidales bacterium]|nr:AmmeMemoRadiSam system radical SAM enzyme [Bacteroidales bacterium]
MGSYFEKSGDRLQCLVCPHNCRIAEGKTGICGVRKNNGEEIELITYGVISGYSADPVEKKPLYHFFPGYKILSIGSYGCNMRCDFCQNYQISQTVPKSGHDDMPPEEIVSAALRTPKNIGIAFTYNEPTIWFEFIRDVSISARNAGLNTVVVSNGYVNPEPLKEITGFIDAFNIDLKSFNDNSYRTLTGAHLEPVLNSLKIIAGSGKHLEVTSLIIPGHNDNLGEMEKQSEWIAGELGKDVPLHLSRYYPMYKRDDPATSTETLLRLYEKASEKLDFVYMGNLHSGEGQDTKCPSCGTVVTQRSGYSTTLKNIDEGKCTGCGTLIYKYFTFSLAQER